jgi:NAD(P)-dependent dehydrogenase (short-subunit alcohol dehydrogenase family)
MSGPRKTAIVTGASQGIGAGIVKGFVERGFNVVANSRKMTQVYGVASLALGTPVELEVIFEVGA